jgi:hypothetical protein
MKEHIKPSIFGPGSASLTLILLLFIGSKENPQEKYSDTYEILFFISFLLFSVAVIWIWHKYLKEFVEFKIEEKLTEPDKKKRDELK